jgi:hypothetical protein
MRDQPIIFAGLALFLGLITFPFWFNLARGQTARGPDIQRPGAQLQCVAPTDYMRTSHMELLIQWRDQVVRRNLRRVTAFNGKVFTASLTNTCLAQCHTNKAQFCDRCHNYSGVGTPYCWDCHNEPRAARASLAPAFTDRGSQP